jgi:pectinesterase
VATSSLTPTPMPTPRKIRRPGRRAQRPRLAFSAPGATRDGQSGEYCAKNRGPLPGTTTPRPEKTRVPSPSAPNRPCHNQAPSQEIPERHAPRPKLLKIPNPNPNPQLPILAAPPTSSWPCSRRGDLRTPVSSLIVPALVVWLAALAPTGARAADAPNPPPDIVVAADGSGDFTTVQAAVASIPRDSHERTIVLVKNGVYREKVRIDADCVTLRGESKDGARIEFAQLNDDFTARTDALGRAVINVDADDFVMENLTAANTAGVVGKHAFTVYGKPDRTVIVDCNLLSDGADTVSLWNGGVGRYYHARCHIRGAVDFVCPRGWCYVEDCSFDETKTSAAMWHDGGKNQDEKFVLRNCTFEGVPGWVLARHHHDAAFYFLSCRFAETMIDRPPQRVVYPLGSAPATDEDRRKNAELDRNNRWGERAYFYDCHRTGGDFPWMADNLDKASEVAAPEHADASEAGRPQPRRLTPEDITPAWTFAGTWDPVATAGPHLESIAWHDGEATVAFSEPVTVKGSPRLKLGSGAAATYARGSGSRELVFKAEGDAAGKPALSVELNGGWIIASQASAALRAAELAPPAK